MEPMTHTHTTTNDQPGGLHPRCGADVLGFRCTRPAGHDGRHVSSSRGELGAALGEALADADVSALDPRNAMRTRISATGHPSNVHPLTITQSPRSTYAIDQLGGLQPRCNVVVPADRIGFHIEPEKGDQPRADYLTVAPAYDAGTVTLLELSSYSADHVLGLIEHAIADGLTGELHLELTYFAPAPGWPWHVTGGYYVDAEGQRS